jgi:hypothetical protein
MPELQTVGTESAALYLLENGHTLVYEHKLWTKSYLSADCDCCSDTFEDAEEALSSLSVWCDGDFKNVKCLGRK